MLERNARGRSPEVTGDGDLVENYPSTVMLTWDNPEIHIVRWPLVRPEEASAEAPVGTQRGHRLGRGWR